MDAMLEYIDKSETISTSDIAYALHMSIEMVEARLERYAALGYVKRTVFHPSSCDRDCKKCHGCSKAKVQKEPMVYWEKVKRPSDMTEVIK